MSKSNSPVGQVTKRSSGGLPDPFALNLLEQLVSNSFLARGQFLDRLVDGRRNIDEECNYPSGEYLPIDYYRALYAREGVAERVVNVWPKETWQVQPEIFDEENTDPDKVDENGSPLETPFKQAFLDLGKSLNGQNTTYDSAFGGHPLWNYCCRADILSGIGTFGIMLLGIDDGLELQAPVAGFPPDGNPYATVTPADNASSPAGQTPIDPQAQTAQVTNPGQVGQQGTSAEDVLSKSIYGEQPQEQQLSSTMGTDAQYFGTQFTPTSYHGGNPTSPMKGGGYEPEQEDVGTGQAQSEEDSQTQAPDEGDEEADDEDDSGLPFLPSSSEYPPSDEFAPGNPGQPTRKLLYIRVFDESMVQVVQYEANIRNPRFGQPLMYLVTLNDPSQPHTGIGLPLATVRVHWSRVIHIADNLRNSEIFGVPRMQPVYNRLLDLRKLYGGSAEMYWAGAFPGLSLETNPNLGGDVLIDQTAVRSMMGQYRNGLQRYLQLTGMSAKVLSPTVVDPTQQVDKQIEAICIELTIPVRVFKGSERGELASNQDDSTWNDRVRHRQVTHVTPRIIVPLIERFILIGILPKPKQWYCKWPDLDAQTKLQKAQILLQKAQAYSAYVAGNVQSIVPPMAFMTKVDDFDEQDAQQILQDAEDKMQEDQEQAQQLAEQHGFEPTPPPGYHDPEQTEMEIKAGAQAGNKPPFGGKPGFGKGPPGAGSTQKPFPGQSSQEEPEA